MYTLNSKSKSIIERNTGISTDDISEIPMHEVESQIERNNHIKIRFRFKKDLRLLGRGSVFFYFMRFLKMNKIDAKLGKI